MEKAKANAVYSKNRKPIGKKWNKMIKIIKWKE